MLKLCYLMEMGRFVGQQCDTEGDPIGRTNANPILDTHSYNVEFNDSQITELMASIITTSMYSQCDPDGSQYILLDSIVDYCKR